KAATAKATAEAAAAAKTAAAAKAAAKAAAATAAALEWIEHRIRRNGIQQAELAAAGATDDLGERGDVDMVHQAGEALEAGLRLGLGFGLIRTLFARSHELDFRPDIVNAVRLVVGERLDGADRAEDALERRPEGNVGQRNGDRRFLDG